MQKNVLMIAYTQISTDARVIRAAKAAVEAGFNVDFYTLNEKTINKLTNFLELDFNKLITQVDLSKHNIGNWKKILNNEEQKLVLKEFPDYSYEK